MMVISATSAPAASFFVLLLLYMFSTSFLLRTVNLAKLMLVNAQPEFTINLPHAIYL